MYKSTVVTDASTISKKDDSPREAVLPPKVRIKNVTKDRFYEIKYDVVDPLEYPRGGSEQGLVIIFNQEKFDGLKFRYGSDKDVQELITAFGRLKFNIYEEYIYKDLTRDQILKNIDKICKSDLKRFNCLICVFLSHGDTNNRLHTFEGQLNAEEIYEPFAECKDLEHKPKLFIFQACKNSKIDNEAIDVDGKYMKELVCNRTIQSDIPKDLLLVYSTLEGDVSFRDERHGTWFIQELCRNFSAYGRRDDVVSLIIRTTKCVASGYYYVHKTDVMKQMPIFISTLTKSFYLCISKERMQLLKVLQDNQETARLLDKITDRVDKLKYP